MNSQIKYLIFLVIVFLAVFIGVSRPIMLFTADLGRHLKNGQIILRDGLSSPVLTTSYYSYTHPDFPAVNHHWLYGVLVYGVWLLGDYLLLSIVNCLMVALGVVIMIYASAPGKSKKILAVAFILCLPLLISRREVRPEILSFLLAAIYWLILTKWQKGKSSWILIFLIPLQVLWTNSHIFFPLGWAIMGSFGLELITKWITKPTWLTLRPLLILLMVGIFSVISALINPFGWKLLLTPLTLFENYNYTVAENQSPFFLIRLGIEPNLQKYAVGLMVISILFLGYLWWRHRRTEHLLALTLLVGLTSLGSFKIMRVYPYFGLFALPLFIIGLSQLRLLGSNLFKHLKIKYENIFWPLVSLGGLIVLFFLLKSNIFIPNPSFLGWGLRTDNLAAGQFYRSLSLKGNIFNNYDIGGYLIHQLPEKSVFVDNRPAEYPGEFFDEYKLAQIKDEAWQTLVKKYDITSIFFFRHDITPWSQQFLITRSQDPAWVPVYVDDYSIIFVKQNPENQSVIDRYQLDRNIFHVVKPNS